MRPDDPARGKSIPPEVVTQITAFLNWDGSPPWASAAPVRAAVEQRIDAEVRAICQAFVRRATETAKTGVGSGKLRITRDLLATIKDEVKFGSAHFGPKVDGISIRVVSLLEEGGFVFERPDADASGPGIRVPLNGAVTLAGCRVQVSGYVAGAAGRGACGSLLPHGVGDSVRSAMELLRKQEAEDASSLTRRVVRAVNIWASRGRRVSPVISVAYFAFERTKTFWWSVDEEERELRWHYVRVFRRHVQPRLEKDGVKVEVVEENEAESVFEFRLRWAEDDEVLTA